MSDGGHRKFILIEMGEYSDSPTAERTKRVICGYKTDWEAVLYDEEITEKNLANDAEMMEEAKKMLCNQRRKAGKDGYCL